MKRIPYLSSLIFSFIFSLHAENKITLTLKPNELVAPENWFKDGSKFFKRIMISGQENRKEIKINEIIKIDSNSVTELEAIRGLMAAGKNDDAISALKSMLDFYEPLQNIPGNSYIPVYFAYIEALDKSGRFEETVKLIGKLKSLALNDDQQKKLQLIQLNVDRQTGASASTVISQAQNILNETDDSAVGAAVWMIIGDVYQRKQEWEKALDAYLNVTVFYGSQIERVPEAELASATILGKMKRFEDAVSVFDRMVIEYAGTELAKVAETQRATMVGMKNDPEPSDAVLPP
jgi:tetratricopeptide (TPR) repeat protein